MGGLNSPLPYTVTFSSLSYPVFSPLHWWREPCVGVAQETSSWTTSLECCLRSVLELILITPPLPPTTTQQPFHLHAAADNVKRSSREVIYRLRCANDHTLQTGNTTLLFSPSKSFCSKGFTVQTTYQDVIVPNNCWRSWPFSHPSAFLCPVLFHPVSLLSSHHIISTEEDLNIKITLKAKGKQQGISQGIPQSWH